MMGVKMLSRFSVIAFTALVTFFAFAQTPQAPAQLLVISGGGGGSSGGGGGEEFTTTYDFASAMTALRALSSEMADFDTPTSPTTTTSSTATNATQIGTGVANGNHVTVVAGDYNHTLNLGSKTDVRITLQEGANIIGQPEGSGLTRILIEGPATCVTLDFPCAYITGESGDFLSFGPSADVTFVNVSIREFESVQWAAEAGNNTSNCNRIAFISSEISVNQYAIYNSYCSHFIFANVFFHHADDTAGGSALTRFGDEGEYVAIIDSYGRNYDRHNIRFDGAWQYVAITDNLFYSLHQFIWGFGIFNDDDPPFACDDFFIHDNDSYTDDLLMSNMDCGPVRWSVLNNTDYGVQIGWPSGGTHTNSGNTNPAYTAPPAWSFQ
jgi:hypothetical protein